MLPSWSWRPKLGQAIAATCALVLGCAGSDRSDGSLPSSAAPALGSSPVRDAAAPPDDPRAAPAHSLPSGEMGGTYRVPVSPELEQYAVFGLPAVRVELHDRQIEIEYELPAMLVGGDQKVSFRGSSQPDAAGIVQLSGEDAQAKCHWLPDVFSCDEKLADIEIDRERLQRRYAELPAAERDARWAVVNAFSDDPIGVLQLPR